MHLKSIRRLASPMKRCLCFGNGTRLPTCSLPSRTVNKRITLMEIIPITQSLIATHASCGLINRTLLIRFKNKQHNPHWSSSFFLSTSGTLESVCHRFSRKAKNVWPMPLVLYGEIV
ncbi:hypothetical protein WN48_03509 [Eufriesea mexicana]|uniref:Uncharacterized protein n=1 Tax=Eufriesea mexicana TaxID=516756 RepID=A0A310SJ99_9HYME|nr:hypothetical protein WN48_03509 [Eufriesea mexicana]